MHIINKTDNNKKYKNIFVAKSHKIKKNVNIFPYRA